MKFSYLLNVAIIIALLSILVISVIAYIDGDLVYLSDQFIIGKCVIKEMTGYDCPSCGLTRSFVSIGHGQLIKSLHYNVAGLLLYILLISQMINSSLFLIRKKYSPHLSRFNWILGIGTCMILIINWILQLF